MKIGIFGDSYGHHEERYNTISWVKHLSNDHDVVSYCQNGASTYLIYNEFIKYQHLYDVVIVLVTYPTRLHTSVLPIPTGGIATFWSRLFRNKLSLTQKRVLQAAGNLIDVAHLDEELTNQFLLFHNLLIEKIKSLRSDILFIPSFAVPGTEFTCTSLYDISLKEEAVWGEQWQTVLRNDARPYDERQCHLCNQNNYILYTQINEVLPKIKGHITFDINLNRFSNPDDIANYVPKKYFE